MENGFYQNTKLDNLNVPDNALIYGTLVTMSGEIKTTYYCIRYDPPHPKYGKWSIWKVSDWVYDKPVPANLKEIKKYLKE